MPIVLISTHTPHVGCDYSRLRHCRPEQISTHTPHVGRDKNSLSQSPDREVFQLTHPMWGATAQLHGKYIGGAISTHTPHVGCDLTERRPSTTPKPRFQLTHPMWGATAPKKNQKFFLKFQLTHPMWGATCLSEPELLGLLKFQLTHPMWGATAAV